MPGERNTPGATSVQPSPTARSPGAWLPTQAAGLSAEAEELREEAVLEQRGEEAAEVAAATAAELGALGADLGVSASGEGGA